MERKKTPALKTVEKALGVLDILGEAQKPMTASEAAKAAGMPISTVYKILSTMVEQGYVEFEESTKFYQTGTKILRFASNIRQQRSISQLAYPIMQEIADITKETVHLGIKEGYYGVFLEKVNSPHTVGVQTKVGRRVPLNLGATAKAIMAFLPDHAFSEFCSGFLDDGTEEGKKAVRKAEEQRARIREDGYSITFEEINPNVAAIAVPIFGFNNIIAGSMAIAGPCERFTPEIINRYIPLIKEYGKRLSERLGANTI